MKEGYYNRIKQSFELLEERFGYTQAEVLKKFQTLGIEVKTTSFNNIINNKSVGIRMLVKCSDGLSEIILSELGLEYNSELLIFQKPKLPINWTPTIIPPFQEEKAETDSGYIFHDKGRLSIQEKVKFISIAQKELVEVGVRLNTFANYFIAEMNKNLKLILQIF